MIKADLYNEIKDDAGIAAIVGTRVFSGSPIEEQSESYITFRIDPEEEYNDVRARAFVRIFCFAKTQKDADDLAVLVKALIDGATNLNGNSYYKVFVFSKVDGNVKLSNGFYYTTLRVEVQYTT